VLTTLEILAMRRSLIDFLFSGQGKISIVSPESSRKFFACPDYSNKIVLDTIRLESIRSFGSLDRKVSSRLLKKTHMPIALSMVEGCAQSPRSRLAYGVWPIAYGFNYMP
jgi:hypothetical protein